MAERQLLSVLLPTGFRTLNEGQGQGQEWRRLRSVNESGISTSKIDLNLRKSLVTVSFYTVALSRQES